VPHEAPRAVWSEVPHEAPREVPREVPRESARGPAPEARRATPAVEPRLGFVAQMMDNGFVFEGPHWRLAESPLQGLYFRPLVYRSVRGLADFEPWLSRIRHFPEDAVDQAVKQIPESWLEEGGHDALSRLLEKLLRRRSRVADLIEDSRAARPEHFPLWRGAAV
jgi:hypothetical protein